MQSLPEIVRLLLSNRSVTDPDEIDRFLYPSYERDLHDPFGIIDMGRAVDRILRAITDGERIAIWGDYDCDGIPGTVILSDFFEKIGYANVRVYIPHRYREGYGLNKAGLALLAQDGVKLVVTVDSGITDIEPVAHARELGIDVIVTDHHLPGPTIPDAYAVVNSKRAEETYAFKYLSGAGVAYKMVCALLSRGAFGVPIGWEKWLLDVAGISTVADMVPLVGENRALAYFGLKVLQKTRRPGLLSLYRKARINSRFITEEDIGFGIGPRINSASRMDEPIRGYELLSSKDPVVAEMLADHLERKNSERKSLVASMVSEVDARAQASLNSPIVVVGDPAWKPGVVGLVASRISERFGKISFVWGCEGATHAKGSCRSDGTVDIVALMHNAPADTFTHFGGHEEAGGFALAEEHTNRLHTHLMQAYEKTSKKERTADNQFCDGPLSVDDVTWRTYDDICLLAPFGVGNPRPTFLFTEKLISGRRFGKTKEHGELSFEQRGGREVKAIQFFVDQDWEQNAVVGNTISFYGHLEKNTFGRQPELRIRIVRFA